MLCSVKIFLSLAQFLSGWMVLRSQLPSSVYLGDASTLRTSSQGGRRGLNHQVQQSADWSWQLLSSARQEAFWSPSIGDCFSEGRCSSEVQDTVIYPAVLPCLCHSMLISCWVLLMEAYKCFCSPAMSICECLKWTSHSFIYFIELLFFVYYKEGINKDTSKKVDGLPIAELPW